VPYDLGAHWMHQSDGQSAGRGRRQERPRRLPGATRQTLAGRRAQCARQRVETFLAGPCGRAARSAISAKPRRTFRRRGCCRRTSATGRRHGIHARAARTGKDSRNFAFDLARAVERDSAAFCRQGYGGLLGKLAAGLPVQLSTPVGMIYWGGNALAVDTPKGNLLTAP